ncbi:MAG: aminotransferase class IV, partial [Phycisphaeraceae bacterium]
TPNTQHPTPNTQHPTPNTMSASIVYLNGRHLDRADAVLSVDERGVHFADGVYEVVRYFNGKAFTMAEHVERLERSLDGIDLAFDAKAVADISDELVARNGLSDARVYWQVTRGAGLRNHIIADDLTPTIYLSAEQAPQLVADQPIPSIAAITTLDDRWHNCWIKSLMLLPNSLAKTKAAKAGAGEALFVRDGRVTEGASTNCFAVFDNELYTHPADRFILEGITRNVVIQLARQLNIPVHEQAFTSADLPAADELFITGTGSLLAAITQVDRNPIADQQPGKVTQQLWQAFIHRVRTDCEQ